MLVHPAGMEELLVGRLEARLAISNGGKTGLSSWQIRHPKAAPQHGAIMVQFRT